MLLNLLRFLPRNQLSWLVGQLAHLRLPPPLGGWSVRQFVRFFRIDPATASQPISSYRSIGEFFTRELAPGLRPLGLEPVSPVDGAVRAAGAITGGMLEQVKGRRYPLAMLLGDEALAARYAAGVVFNLYLSPPDYHHVHSPVSGSIRAARWIPGTLWPVNDWSVNRIENLFGRNERIVIEIESPRFGLVTCVMVGATNVGRMSVTFDDIVTNSSPGRFRPGQRERRYTPAPAVTAGDRLGTFHLGSTVILLFEAGRLEGGAVQPGERIQMGHSLVAPGGAEHAKNL